MTSYLIRLPWPDPKLNQNSRTHWRVKAPITAEARSTAAALTREKTGRAAWPTDAARLIFTAHPPDRRHRDIQNLPGALKAAIDGISDAIRIDDKHFYVRFPEMFEDPTKGGAILVLIEPIEGKS